MHSPPRLILALAAIMLIVACDDDDAANAPRQLPPETPPNFYAVAPPPPPPNPAQIGVADFVSFGTTLVHNQTVTRNVTITNTGGEPLQITGIDVSGPQHYQVAHECAEPVAPGAACVAHVSFAPEEAGDFDGSLIVASASGLTRVPLSAKVNEPPPAVVTAPQPPPPPPPAPPKVDRRAEMLRALAEARLSARNAAGPFKIARNDDITGVLPATYTMTDENYLREGTPSLESGFPVNRRFIHTMDRLVWTVLDREINSQLPGIVVFRVDQPVYGTDGRTVLFERGDGFLARYEPLQRVGDTRLNLCIFRVIRLADGAHVFSEEDQCFAYATDAQAKVGLVGDVDNRTFEKYGTAFTVAGISALASIGAGVADETVPGLDQGTSTLTDQLGQITASLIEQNVDLAPIITVAAGERVGIQFLRDIYLRRPEIQTKE